MLGACIRSTCIVLPNSGVVHEASFKSTSSRLLFFHGTLHDFKCNNKLLDYLQLFGELLLLCLEFPLDLIDHEVGIAQKAHSTSFKIFGQSHANDNFFVFYLVV